MSPPLPVPVCGRAEVMVKRRTVRAQQRQEALAERKHMASEPCSASELVRLAELHGGAIAEAFDRTAARVGP